MSFNEGFALGEHDLDLTNHTREEIRDPEKIGAIETPKASENFHENNGKLLITPENLMPENISVVVGARSAEKDSIEWTDKIFAAEAGIDPTKTIRVQQGHTANVIEVGAGDAPAFDLIKDEAGKVVDDKRKKTADGSKVDSAWTKDKDVTLMIGSADCAAVTISGKDKDNKDIIGIAHSGIAGSQKDITGNLIGEMTGKGESDVDSFKVYVAPSVCDRCFPILSETASDEQVEKTMSKTEGVELTSASESFKDFQSKYGDKFKEVFGRELSQNDFFYVAQNDKSENKLHYRIDNQILISLVCKGVKLENIGFSEICTKNDGLPSHKARGETTGVYSTITIK